MSDASAQSPRGTGSLGDPRCERRGRALGLQLVRLLALSHGESAVSEARWGEMREMERCRAERLGPPVAGAAAPVGAAPRA